MRPMLYALSLLVAGGAAMFAATGPSQALPAAPLGQVQGAAENATGLVEKATYYGYKRHYRRYWYPRYRRYHHYKRHRYHKRRYYGRHHYRRHYRHRYHRRHHRHYRRW